MMNIYQKLIEVRKVVKYLKKENEGAQYKYVSSSQTLAAVKEKLDELGLLLIPSVTAKTVHKDIYEKVYKGETKRAVDYFTELEMDFTWINAENPEETIICHWYGQGLDTGEKGVGKALTYAEKYFILKFFNIPTDKDDPDSFQDKIDNKTAPKPEVKPKSIDADAQLKRDLVEQFKGDKVAAKKEYDRIVAVRNEPQQEELDPDAVKYMEEKFQIEGGK